MQVQIAVSWNDDLMGRLARKLGFNWGHAALKYRGEMENEWTVIEALWKGVIRHPWIEFEERWDEIKLFETKVDLSVIEQNRIVAFANGNVGRPYDFGLLLRIIWECLKKKFGLGIVAYSSHVCSSLVYASFLYAGLNLVPYARNLVVTPDDLAESDLLKDAS